MLKKSSFMHKNLNSMFLTLPLDGQVVVSMKACVLDIKLIVIYFSNFLLAVSQDLLNKIKHAKVTKMNSSSSFLKQTSKSFHAYY